MHRTVLARLPAHSPFWPRMVVRTVSRRATSPLARLALLHEQWLGDFADESVRVEQVRMGESDAVVR